MTFSRSIGQLILLRIASCNQQDRFLVEGWRLLIEIGEPDIPRKDYSSDLAHSWVKNTWFLTQEYGFPLIYFSVQKY